ncbi:hypothetical protein QFZ50_002719 [Arthrobacter agilis]|nr:hypothetical protein [Arthrobacter agilis]
MRPDRAPGTAGRRAADRRSVVVDLGDHEASGSPQGAPGARSTPGARCVPGAPDGPGSTDTGVTAATDTADADAERARRRRTACLAAGVVALLVVAANLAPRGDGPPPLGKAAEVQDRPLSVCEAVAFANRTGELPARPAVLPGRANGYFAVTDPAGRATTVVGLTYQDGTISLCRPVREAGTGSPAPGQYELPLLRRGDTYAYEPGPSGLALVGERSADGTIVRGAPASWVAPARPRHSPARMP